MRGMGPRYSFRGLDRQGGIGGESKKKSDSSFESSSSPRRKREKRDGIKAKAKDAAIAGHTSRSLNSTKENTRGFLSCLSLFACCSLFTWPIQLHAGDRCDEDRKKG